MSRACGEPMKLSECSNPLEAFVTLVICVLRTELEVFARAVTAFNYCGATPAPILFALKVLTFLVFGISVKIKHT